MSTFLDILIILALGFLVLTLFSFFNEKVLKLPIEIGLMSISFVVSIVILMLELFGVTSIIESGHILEKLDLNDIIMNGFLCFLLFSGSVKIRFTDLASDKYLISTLAFFSTLLATLIYAGIFYFVSDLLALDFTFIQSCILGSIIAPTDPISAMSILQKAGLPRRLSLIMEGESLFNDGVAVALFVTFVTLNNTTSEVNPVIIFLEIIFMKIIGAIVVGLVIAFVLFKIFKSTNEKETEIFVSLAAVTSAYAISELIGVSAPIAAVVVGIYFATNMHNLHKEFDNVEEYYVNFYSFWSVIDKILNGILYILIGFAVLFLYKTSGVMITIVTAIIIAFIARFTSILIPIYFFSKDKKSKKINRSKFSRLNEKIAMSKLLTWGGLKGGICIALALGTITMFPSDQYNHIIGSTYAVVAFSILVQGLTIKKFYNNIKDDF